MRLVLAEKPSVALELAKALGCRKREQGYFAGPTHWVTYAIGHIVRLADPNEMNPAWGKPWRREALPMLPGAATAAVTAATASPWRYLPETRTQAQYDLIVRLFHDPRFTEIVNATDAGREGEAIFRRIYELSGSGKPVLRFWTSSLTEEAIAEALARLRPAHEYDALAAAAQARAQLDWLIGMNHTRAATLHNGMLCSVGRVQTPTLAILVERHHAIANWIRAYFYEVHADLGDFLCRALAPKASGEAPGNASAKGSARYDFAVKAEAEAILADIPEGTPALVTAVEKKPRRIPPPQLHNLGELQKEANRRFGLTSDRTLEVAQTLYERKAITYPRSSSRYLGDDLVPALPGILRALKLPGKEALVDAALARTKKGPKLGKRFIDASKLSDHHAIIPTAKSAPGRLSQDEQRVYQIVAERFLVIFLPDKETEETRIDLEIAGHPFRAQGVRLVAPGWTALHGSAAEFDAKAEEPEDRQALPAVKAGTILSVLDGEVVTRERKPPVPFTDATLLAAMETAGRTLDDDALREAMRGRGLGTEATRAAIIKRLLELDYITRDGKNFVVTGKGLALIAQILPHLASPELTGDMEAKLALVEQGKLDASLLLEEVAQSLRQDIPQVFQTVPMQAARVAPIEVGKDDLLCPQCKAGLLSQRPGQAFFGCGRFREGCQFTLSTTVAGKKLNAAQIRKLITSSGHCTALIQGFKSKTGREFAAALYLNPQAGWKTEFQFER